MTQSTVLRYLNSLINANYLYQDEDTLRYGLTWKICKLAYELDAYVSLRGIAGSFIAELSDKYNLGACLVVPSEGSCLYLDCVDRSVTRGRTLQRIGTKTPMNASSSGKVLLSGYTDAMLSSHIEQYGLEKLTENTITDKESFLAEIAKVRDRDYGTDYEECEYGICCVSVPLRTFTGRLYAALSMFGGSREMLPEFVETELISSLRAAASVISGRLGYHSPGQSQSASEPQQDRF